VDPATRGLARADIPETLLAAWFMLLSCFTRSSNLKTDALCSSEISFGFHTIAWRYILQDRILRNRRGQEVKAQTFKTRLKVIGRQTVA
jgi:hypothetical protein